MAEEDKGKEALAGVMLGGAAGVGVGYLLGKVSKAEAAPEEPKEVIVVFQLDEETRASIALTVAAALEPTLKELAMVPKEQKQVVFKHTLEALQGVTDHQRIPMLKTVRTITIHWPDGCGGEEGALVDVAVGYSQDKRLLPEEGYLALNDTTPTWAINKDVDSNTLWVEIRNGDSDITHTHTISVIINYEEAS